MCGVASCFAYTLTCSVIHASLSVLERSRAVGTRLVQTRSQVHLLSRPPRRQTRSTCFKLVSSAELAFEYAVSRRLRCELDLQGRLMDRRAALFWL